MSIHPLEHPHGRSGHRSLETPLYPMQNTDRMLSLAIVIPAFNEEARLGRTLDAIHRASPEHQLGSLSLTQVIVVDDGSHDATVAIARSWEGRLPIEVYLLPQNRGKGAAVREGMRHLRADLSLLYDADGAAPITEVPKLAAALQERRADIAIGSRVLGRSSGLVAMRWYRRFIGRTYHWLCSGLVPGIKDTACGCKLFTRTAAEHLFSRQHIDRFSFDVEVLALALRSGFKIAEVPLQWTAVPESKVRLLRDGIQMFLSVILLYIRRMVRRLSRNVIEK